MRNNLSLIVLSVTLLFLTACSGTQKRPGAIDIPEENKVVEFAYDKEFIRMNKSGGGFDYIYQQEGKNLLNYTLNNTELAGKPIKILAYDQPYILGETLNIPIKENKEEIQCLFNVAKPTFKFAVENTVNAQKKHGYKTFLNKELNKKNKQYAEYITYKKSGRVNYFGLMKFRTVKVKNNKRISNIFCLHTGAGYRLTMYRVMDEIVDQLEKM